MARVLVAEDDEAVSLLIAKTLEADGHEVVTVFSGLDAIDVGSAGGFDLVVLDQFLPDRFGMEVLAALREAGHDVPVIVVSGLDDEDEVVKFFHLGATDFIQKPFSRAELRARIAVRLGDTGSA
jgi:DNA-binding response OmpR family regulator